MVSYIYDNIDDYEYPYNVLILIVVDNGLVLFDLLTDVSNKLSLNPYCSGQWSRTRPYKTILIISKLKNFTKQILTFLNRKLTIP